MTSRWRAQRRAFWVLARARVAETLRERAAVGFLFAFPALLLVSLTMVFAEGHPYERRPVVIDCDRPAVLSLLATEFTSLSVQRASPSVARRMLFDARAEIRLTCEGGALWLEHGPRARLTARAVALLLAGEGARDREVSIPKGAYARGLLPGSIAFGALFAGLYGLGLPMLRFRRTRLLARLSLTPLRPLTFVLAQLSARALLTVAQSLAMLAVGALLFREPFALRVWATVATVVLLGVLAFAGVGLALASVVTHEDTHGDLLAASATPLVLLSGAFFAVDEMPAWLATVARALPSTALVDALRAALDPSGEGITRPALVLAAWAIATLSLGLYAFDWRK